jgi:hypothetical protein
MIDGHDRLYQQLARRRRGQPAASASATRAREKVTAR